MGSFFNQPNGKSEQISHKRDSLASCWRDKGTAKLDPYSFRSEENIKFPSWWLYSPFKRSDEAYQPIEELFLNLRGTWDSLLRNSESGETSGILELRQGNLSNQSQTSLCLKWKTLSLINCKQPKII